MRDPEKLFVVRQILSHPCPACGYQRKICEWSDCLQDAEFEAWFGSGLMRKMQVCREHAKESYAYKQHGEKAIKEAT